MVEARVDELERDDLALEEPAQLRGAIRRRCESRYPPRIDVAGEREVAFAFVHVLGVQDGEAVGAEPALVERLFAAAFTVAETREQRDAVEHERAVGGEDHVGETAHRGRSSRPDVPACS